MKRSRVNELLRSGEAFIRSFGYALPPFAAWSPSEMRARRDVAGMIAERGLGWDVTDFGGGDFDRLGLFLFTTRNGQACDLKAGRGMLYAEKIMIARRDQMTPMHRHDLKAEDIVNRGGATLALQLFTAAPDGAIDEALPVRVVADGLARTMKGGDILTLSPGESVTLMPRVDWHAFWGEGGDVLIGEVSTVNDDQGDNVFRDPVGRFAEIEEDDEPRRLLVSDYERWL